VVRHHEQSIYATHQFFTGSGRRGLRQDVKDDLVTEGYNVIETCMFKENVNVL
jgi:hypothetical protein